MIELFLPPGKGMDLDELLHDEETLGWWRFEMPDGKVLVKDPTPLLYHGEIVYRNGNVAGYIRAASYGFTLGGAVGLAMIHHTESIKINWPNDGKWEVEIGAKKYPAKASLRPLYDPKNERIKG